MSNRKRSLARAKVRKEYEGTCSKGSGSHQGQSRMLPVGIFRPKFFDSPPHFPLHVRPVPRKLLRDY